MIPLLVIIADLVGIYGGYIGYNVHGSMSWLSSYRSSLIFSLVPAIRKRSFFGFFFGVIGCSEF
jgi:phospholipid/cholesterol/gamma-HCH transport system permease protein